MLFSSATKLILLQYNVDGGKSLQKGNFEDLNKLVFREDKMKVMSFMSNVGLK